MAALLWLARDFRFHDNLALQVAAKAGPVLPVFVIDHATRALGSAARWRLQRAVAAFDVAWQARTGAQIMVVEGEAADHLPGLAQNLCIDQIHQNDWPYAPQRRAQAELREQLHGSGIMLTLHQGHLLIAPQRLQAEKGSAYRVYTPFARALRRLGPDAAMPEVTTITALPGEGHLPDLAKDMYGGAAVLARFALPVGADKALTRLNAFLEAPQAYPEGRDRPDISVCSQLSEHLALGEISPRTIWAKAEARSQSAPHLRPAIDKFLSELIWREFAWHLLIDFPQMAQQTWRSDWRDFPWRGDGPGVEAWRRGQTGVPLVDAGLREMRVTGRMHNRVRMVVASWLTKHLLADWRLGEAFFADSLTDWDPAANAMNWQWVAGCGPDASPFFRIFNPVKQATDFDPQGLYRRMFLSQHGVEPTAQAAAYFEAIPARWQVARHYQDLATPERLAEGRALALAALKASRG